MNIRKAFFTQFKRLLSLQLIMFSGATCACDLHGTGGFGFSMYGPKHQEWLAAPVAPASKIKLRYPFMKKISTSELSDISIQYELPIDVERATLELKSSKMLELKGEKILTLSKEGGVHYIQVEAETNGQHVLTLRVHALQNNKPISMTKRIFVKAEPSNQG